MKIGYDARADHLFVALGDLTRSQPAKEIAPGVYLYGSAEGAVLGLMVSNASSHYPAEELNQVSTYNDAEISLAEAALLSGISIVGLNSAIRHGRLQGKKVGRNWTTTMRALAEYLSSRRPEKREKPPAEAGGRVKI